MPMYEYECNMCHTKTKELTSFNKRRHPIPCKKCGSGSLLYKPRDFGNGLKEKE